MDIEQLITQNTDNDIKDLTELKQILEDIHQENADFHHNQAFQKLYQELKKISDFNDLPLVRRNYFLTLFSQGLSKMSVKQKNKIKINKDLNLIIDLENKLKNPQVTDTEKITILQKYKTIKAIPEIDTLNFLLQQNNKTIQKLILTEYASFIDLPNFLNIIHNRNKENEDIRILTIKKAGLRLDLTDSFYSELILDPTEDPEIIQLTIDLYHSKIEQKVLIQFFLNKNNLLELRLQVLRKLPLRISGNEKFLTELLLDNNENIKIKTNLLLVFKHKIPIQYLRDYFLANNITNEEKFTLLKLVTDQFLEINKNNTLDMLFILMQEYQKGRKLLLESNKLNSDFLFNLLLKNEINQNVKEEIYHYYKEKFNDETFQNLAIELIKNPATALNLRKKILQDFAKIISLEIIIFIINNNEDNTDFRIELLQEYMNLIKREKYIYKLEKLFENQQQPLKLINLVLKYFYLELNEDLVARYLLNQELNNSLKKLLLSLKKVGFLKANSYYFQNILQQKKALVEIIFFRENFLNYFPPTEILILYKDDFQKKSVIEVIDHLSLNTKIKINLLKLLLFTDFINLNDKLLILKKTINNINNDEFLNIITSNTLPLAIKEQCLKAQPKRTDLNLNGALDFIVLDEQEDFKLRQLIKEEYGEFLVTIKQ